MAQRLNIDRIWWRNVPLGEFYNIERYHRIKGGGGSLYIEIPSSMVPATLDFLDSPRDKGSSFPVIVIEAGVIGQPGLSGPVEFGPKSGGRGRIVRQNRQQPYSQRHPAWTADRKFPTAPDSVSNKEEARPYFPDGGLRIYIAKTVEGDYYAGFTKGRRPVGMNSSHPSWDLYSQGRIPGGVIDAG